MYISDNCPRGKGPVMIDVYTEEDVTEGRRKKDDKLPRCTYHKRLKCDADECLYHPEHYLKKQGK